MLYLQTLQPCSPFFTLLASSVGLATMIMAMLHGGVMNDYARYSSLGINLITLALVFLAMGFSIKGQERRAFSGASRVPREMKTLLSFNIIEAFLMLLYVAGLGLFKHETSVPPAVTRDDTVYTTGGPTTAPKTVGHHGIQEERAIAA